VLELAATREDMGAINPTLQPLDILRLSLDKPPETYRRREKPYFSLLLPNPAKTPVLLYGYTQIRGK
jgi:hypothetical protein